MISLQKVIESRNGVGGHPVNEVECWSLLGQTGHALQDHLLKVNRSGMASALPIITPQRLMCTGSGKVVLALVEGSKSFSTRRGRSAEQYHRHPVVLGGRGSNEGELNERELEAIGVFSLAKTIKLCIGNASSRMSDPLRRLLVGMTETDLSRSVTLLELLRRVSDNWASMVGSAPISRFVSQMYRSTSNNSEHHRSCSAIPLMTNHDSRANIILNQCVLEPVIAPPQRPPPPPTSYSSSTSNLPPPSAVSGEIEFSRLDTSSSSSTSSSSAAPAAEAASTAVVAATTSQTNDDDDNNPLSSPFAASMPNLNNNNNVEVDKEGSVNNAEESSKSETRKRGYGRRLDYQPPRRGEKRL